MHKLITICACVFIFIKTYAQINLIPNFSFENYASCPSGSEQLPLAIPWVSPANGGDGGIYLNACSTSPYYSVPDQVYNFQEAHSGNAFIGIYLYHSLANYREYAQVQLLSALAAGQCYYVEFFTNRATGIYGGKYAINNIGCSFTNTAINTTGTGYVLNLTPHVLEFNNSIITDTINWVKIAGIYVASGGEQYITIGNFFDDANTDTLSIDDEPYNSATYFFDDVSVIPIDSLLDGMPAYAGADTNVILGDSVFIGQEISNLNCNWYNAGGSLIASGTSGIYVSPTTSTFFVVEQNLCGTITYDTVNVTVLPTSINELLNENNVNIYPNPTTGETTLEMVGSESNEWLMAVLDVQGRTVAEKLFNGSKIKIKLALDNGVYLVRITNKNTNETVIKKLIINR